MTGKRLIGALVLALGFASPSLAQFNSVCGPPTVCVSPDTLTFAVLHTPTLTVSGSETITGTLIWPLGGVSTNGRVTFGTSITVPTIGPNFSQQHTIPAVTSDTFGLLNAAQTFANKSISGSANTLTNIPNSALTNSSLTISPGTGMSGGGSVSLGGSVTLTNAGVTSIAGTASQINASASTGAITLSLVGPYTPATFTSNGILYGNGSSSISVTAQGASGTVLHGNGGTPTFAPVTLTTDVTGVLPLANGGTNANLTASNGGIVYSTASAEAILAGTATAGQILRSGATAAPTWSTATFPATATSTNQALVADGTNWVSAAIVNSITGTANQVTASASTGAITLSLPQSINTTATLLLTKVTLGAASGTTGSIDFKGATSGTITLTTSAAAGTWTLTMPNTAGTSGYVLSTDGTGITSWIANGSGGGVTSVAGTANQIAVSGSTGAVTFSLVGPYTPATYTTNGILYGSGTSSIGVTAQGASGTVLHGNGGTPTFAAVSLTVDVSGVLPLANGGTNGNLTASNGGIFYSTATAGAILAGTATAGQILRSGASGAPSWSTATYPATAGTSGNALVSDGTNLLSTAIVNSITGTANQVTASASTGAITLSLPQSINTTASPLFTKFTLGAAAGITGSIDFKGSNSGIVTLTVANTAGTWTLTMPTTAGTAGYVLQTDGTGITSWVAQGGGSGVSSAIGTSNQINVSGATGAVTFSISSTFVVPGTLAITSTASSNATTEAASSTTGSFTFAGGVGIAKKLFVGTLIDVPAIEVGVTTITSTSTGQIYVGTNTNSQIYLDTANSSTNNIGALVFRQEGGTLASPSNLVATSLFGKILWQGRIAGSYADMASILPSFNGSTTEGQIQFSILHSGSLAANVVRFDGLGNVVAAGDYYSHGSAGVTADCGVGDTCHFVGGIFTGIN